MLTVLTTHVELLMLAELTTTVVLLMLAGLTTNLELLMLALDVLVEAEQLEKSTDAGVVVLAVAV